jgi:hypothetical protein
VVINGRVVKYDHRLVDIDLAKAGSAQRKGTADSDPSA